MFKIFYHQDVVAIDIPKISSANRLRIKNSIEMKLVERPEVYGKPLRKSLRAYRSLRVGDFRVVYRIEKKLVKVLLIAHRAVVYRQAEKRQGNSF